MVAFDISAFKDEEAVNPPQTKGSIAPEDNPMVPRVKQSYEAKRWREIGPFLTKANIADGTKDGKGVYISEAALAERYIRAAARSLDLGLSLRRGEPTKDGKVTLYYLGTEKRKRATKAEIEARKAAEAAGGAVAGQATLDEASGDTTSPDTQPEAAPSAA